ncbi:unnamed protein product [Rotaria sp. Silwood2]|nr:unnamed protein product [Rotaria sp. Silwood2]
MRERAENELLSLQKVAEREIRKALLTSEALVVLPRVANIDMILICLCKFTEKTVRKGCFFHFSQAIYGHVKSGGLSAVYLDNLMIHSVIRKTMKLALVPEQHLPSLFARLG